MRPLPATSVVVFVVVFAAALAACNSQPSKSAAQSGERVDASGQHSPYPPAQEDPSKRGNYTPGGLYAPGVDDSAPAGGIPDIDLIPEPVVRAEPRSRYGNRSPYTVLGKSYRVLDSAEGYDETGIASFYGKKFHGRRTSSLEVYDMYAFTAAHKSLPLPSYARVTNLSNGRSVVVRVNDRGPFHDGRIIDLSYAAAVKLGVDRTGTARVEVEGLAPGEDAPVPGDAVAATAGTAPAKPVPPSAMDRLVGALPVATASAAEHPPQAAVAPGPVPSRDDRRAWRFDMHQDGRAMTADEFDAWMRARRVSVATGKPTALAAKAVADRAGADSGARADFSDTPASAPAATPRPSASVPAPAAGGIVLQVASFAAHANAERALAMLTDAGIAGARLQDADADGRHVWRLRVGPVPASGEVDLAARIRGLGFDQPLRVRE